MPPPHPVPRSSTGYNYMLENCAHCVHTGQSVPTWKLYAESSHEFKDSFV